MQAFLQSLPFVIFSFGAPAFIVLAYAFWRKRAASSWLLRFFTICCATAFVLNLISLVFLVENPLLSGCRTLLVSVLPPLMLQLTGERAASAKNFGRSKWLLTLTLLYVLAVSFAVARQAEYGGFFDDTAALMLAASATLALGIIWFFFPPGNERIWMLSIFAAFFLTGLSTMFSDNPLLEIVPDYLLVVFFSVHLYYSERLVFFDVFLRAGAFVAAGVLLLAGTFALGAIFAPSSGWNGIWFTALAVAPLWSCAPFLYKKLGFWIDGRLGRRYSVAQAESVFIHKLQNAMSAAELHHAAVEAVESIFDCRPVIDFARNLDSNGDDSVAHIEPQGYIALKAPRRPLLSDDVRLLNSFATTLGVMLQNVRLRAQRAELVDLAGRAQLRALRAQINPHFLFNALNAVAGCVGSRPDLAEDTLANLADVFRYVLSRSDQEWVRFSEEVAFIRAYLAVEQARFGTRLQVEFRHDEACLGIHIPAMIVQPLVENAIKHGCSKVVGIGKITIVATAMERGLVVTVADNGPGFPADYSSERSAGHGLRNVSDRMRGYYGDRRNIDWESGESGTTVSLTIPMMEHRECAS